jgi:hypothetical protein
VKRTWPRKLWLLATDRAYRLEAFLMLRGAPRGPRWPGKLPPRLHWLRGCNRQRRLHRASVRHCLAEVERLRAVYPRDWQRFYFAQVQLMRAMEASRGSRIRARRAHAAWEAERGAR